MLLIPGCKNIQSYLLGFFHDFKHSALPVVLNHKEIKSVSQTRNTYHFVICLYLTREQHTAGHVHHFQPEIHSTT